MRLWFYSSSNTQKVIILVIACLSGRGFAGGQTQPLTWEACVKEATEHNASLLAAKESANRAESQVGSAYAPFLPQLSGSLGYTRSGSDGNPVLDPTGGVVGGGSNQNQYSAALTSSVNIFNGFQDRAKLDQARETLESQRAALRGQKAILHQDLKKAFAQLLYSQEALSLSKDIEKRRKDNADLVEMRFQGGRENKGSYLKTKASYRQAQFDVSQGERNLRVAQKQLARLLGRDLLEPVSVKGELSTKKLPGLKQNFRELAKLTPQATQSVHDFKVAEAGVSKAYGAFYPSLALNGSLSRTGSDFPPNTNRWSAGVTLTVPLFQWGNFGEVSSAKADERRAEVNVRNAEEQAGVKLEETYANLASAVERAEVQEETLSAALVRAEIARSQYSAGIVSYNDWDIIENDLMTQQQSLLALKREAIVAEANWEQALGKGDIP